MRGKKVCVAHGGKGGRPPVHGRRSTFLKLFGERYRKAESAPDFLRHEPDVAAFDTWLAQLEERWPNHDAPAWRSQLRALAEAFEAANASRDSKKLVEALATLWPLLLAAIRDGADHDQMWEDLLRNRERRAALADRERSAQTKAEQVLTMREMVILFGRMAEIVKAEVGERDGLRVAARFEREVFGGGSLDNGNREDGVAAVN